MKAQFLSSIIITAFALSLDLFFKSFLALNVATSTLGIFFSIIDILNFCLIILTGFKSSMIVAYNKNHNDLKLVNIFRFFIVLLVLLTWGFILPFIKHKLNVDIHYWYLVGLIISISYVTYLKNTISMYRMYTLINIATFLEYTLITAWFFLVFYNYNLKPLHSLFIAFIMGFFSLSVVIFILKRQKYKEPKLKWISWVNMNEDDKHFIKNSLIATLEFGSGLLNVYLAVLFMAYYFTVEALGLFQVLVKPVYTFALMVFAFPIFRFIFPDLVLHIKNKDFVSLFKIQKFIYQYAFLITLFIIIFFYSFAEKLVTQYFGASYIKTIDWLQIVIYIIFFSIINAYQVAFIKANGHFWIAFILRFLGIIFFVFCFFALFYIGYGPISIMFALLAANIFMAFLALLLKQIIFKQLLIQI